MTALPGADAVRGLLNGLFDRAVTAADEPTPVLRGRDVHVVGSYVDDTGSVRAVAFCDLVMGNVLGGPDDGPGSDIGMDERVHHLGARFPQVKVHLYGKAFRPGRKLGHVNIVGSDLPELRRIAQLAATWLGTGRWGDGYDLHAGEVSGRLDGAAAGSAG